MEQKYITVCVLLVLFGTPVRGDAESDDSWCFAKKVGGVVGIGIGAVALAPVAISAAGFGSAGIAAGSVAAKLMAMSAAANGGGVVAGGVVAGLQSAGAAGLSLATKAVIGTTFVLNIQIPLYIKATMERRYITVCVLFVLFGTPIQGDAESTEKNGWTSDDVWCETKKYGGGALLGIGTVAATPYVLGVVGFTGAGIAVGSAAAKLMSMFAVYNGGGVVAGGVVATLQSVGAAGLGLGGQAAMVSTVGGTYSYLAGGCAKDDIECIKKRK